MANWLGSIKNWISERRQSVARWFKKLIDLQLAVNTSEKQILEHKINSHLLSDELATMLKATDYYNNKTDIQRKKPELDWKSNNKIELGLFKKLVRQKVGYLLAKAPSISTDNKETNLYLNKQVFDKELLKTIKSLGQEAIVKGVAYSIVYLNEEGQIKLFKVPSEQIIPIWSDEKKSSLDAFLRVYTITKWEDGIEYEKQQVEYWTEQGVAYYLLEAGRLIVDDRYDDIQPHFYYTNGQEVTGMNWSTVPLIPWRYNEDEQSLLHQVKSLIDNLSTQSSVNADILADIPKLIYVLKNYGGQSLEEFNIGINKWKAIKVDDGGGVDTLNADADTHGAEMEMKRTRKALYEAGSGIDTQDENLGNASGLALKWRYTDLDLDMNDMEAELQDSIETFMRFVAEHADNTDEKLLELDTFKYVFNRDIITNEEEVIRDAKASKGIIDDVTIMENHPWYTNEVMNRLDKQPLSPEEQKQIAEVRQIKLESILMIAPRIGDEKALELFCQELDIDYEEVKAMLQESDLPLDEGVDYDEEAEQMANRAT